MKIDAIELVRFRLPLVLAFRTSFGTQTERDVLLVCVHSGDIRGWGECVSGEDPGYSSEFVDASEQVIARFLAPRLLVRESVTAAQVEGILHSVRGHKMAKAAVEMAVLDAQLRQRGTPLSEHLGGVRREVEVGVSVGITDTIPRLLDLVEGYLAQGYRRIKLKIEPGWDLAPLQAVREHFGSELLLQVDANTAYSRSDIPHLCRLDPYELLLIEQPFGREDLEAHAELGRRSATPVCLDESIESVGDALRAIALSAASVVNIKAGRVGGYLEARRIHDLCAASGIPVWCGGMLETGVGRAANIALASLANFVLPGDISASSRYFERDITAPFELVGSALSVPEGPGIGVEVDEDRLTELGATRHLIRPGS